MPIGRVLHVARGMLIGTSLHVARILLNVLALALMFQGAALLIVAPSYAGFRVGGCFEILCAWGLARVRIPWSLSVEKLIEQPNAR